MTSSNLRARRLRAITIVVLLAGVCPTPTPAQSAVQRVVDTMPGVPVDTVPVTTVVIPKDLRSPRATMETFLTAMSEVGEGSSASLSRAITTLDLDKINPLVRYEKGGDLAWMLREALRRTREPDTARFATRTEGSPYLFQSYATGRIEIAFTPDIGWRFSRDTLSALPAILEELRLAQAQDAKSLGADLALPVYLRLRALVPQRLKQTTLGLEQWQWLGIAATAVLGLLLDRAVAFALHFAVRSWRRRYAHGAFRELSDEMLRPFGLMTMAFAWWAGLNALGLPAGVLLVLLVSVKFMACIASVWAAYRLVDLLRALLEDRALATSSRLDDAVVPLVTKSLKLFVTVLGILFIADNLDIDITSLLAGLGLGGLALALAAKDVASNLFGSITVLLDQTFQVGDSVVIGDVEGTVERIGFRSTRIRTFKNSLVSVPNSLVTTASVDNLGSRIYRTFHCKLAIAYGTSPERIEAYCEGIRELVRVHPYTRKDQHQVYLHELGDNALLVMIYLFWQVPDWGTELRERHRFLLDCLRLAAALGIEFAYPMRTVHVKASPDDPLLEGLQTGLQVATDSGREPSPGMPAISLAPADVRALARTIVSATTGVGVIPPPVGLADYLGEDLRT